MRRSKKNRHSEEESNERWLVSYADFITLMFAFFTVLYATSEQNTQKTQDFENSVKKYLIKAGVVGTGANKSIEKKDNFNDVIDPPLKTYPREKEKNISTLTQLEDQLMEALGEEEVNQVILDLAPHDYGVRLSIDATKIFADDEIKFRGSYIKIVDKLALVLKDLNKKIYVQGHAAGPIRVNGVSNHWDLAALRTSLIIRYFIQKHELSGRQLIAISYGSEKPVFSNNGSQRAKNNRLEFLILTEEGPL